MTTEMVPVDAAPLVDAASASAMVDQASMMAKKLGDVIKSGRLAIKISGREYVKCEGWTTLGAMMAVFPHIVWTRRLDDDGGWEARCEVKRADGAVLGAAEAQCGMDEKMWASRSSNARRSMAQTRATSKAMRVVFSWVMTLAGYEATPAEEMDFAQEERRPPAQRATSTPPPPPSEARPAPPEAAPAEADNKRCSEKQAKAILSIVWDKSPAPEDWMRQNIPDAVDASGNVGWAGIQASLTPAQASNLIKQCQEAEVL